VLQNAQATLDNAVLQDRSRRDINGATLGSDNDNGTLECDVAAQVDSTSDGQVVKLDNAGDAGNALLEVGDLLEVRSQLDDGDTAETVGVHDQLAVLQTVQIRLDNHQVGAGLDR